MSEWFRDWFKSQFYLKLYSHRDSGDAAELLELIFSNIEIPPGAKILDAGCGAGRHSIICAGKGFDVSGFDLSPTLLNIAEENAVRAGVKIDFFQADFRSVHLKKKYNLILNLFTSFGYFKKDEENFSFIRKVYNYLYEDGFFALDFLNRNYVITNLIPESVKRFDDLLLIERRSVENGRVIKKIIAEDKSGAHVFNESVRLYSKREIVNAFEDAGYRLYKIFGGYSGEEFDINKSKRLILLFRK